LGSLLLIFFFDFNFLSSLQLLLHGLDMRKLLCHSVGGVVKILRRILGKRELIVLHLGKNRE
jgi:hypothetical protein